jgi:hypothetical protein
MFLVDTDVETFRYSIPPHQMPPFITSAEIRLFFIWTLKATKRGEIVEKQAS